MSPGIDISRTLLWIVLLPLLGALVNGLAGRNASKKLVSGVAVGSVFGAFLLSLVGFGFLLAADDETRIVHDVYEWFSISVRGVDVPIRVRFVMDHLSGLMTVMVTGIGALIHVYSIGYMEEDPGYWRFMTYLNLFMASMLILVLASNLPLMFVGWEGVGLCSYLLIGFWYTNAEYAAAGRKAFVVNRIGDFGVLIGMFLLVSAVADPRTPEAFEFSTINSAAMRLGLTEVTMGASAIGVSIATAATLFMFLGCAGKSAQIPLYVWLPDAMAGPTPVSALIHAATMVTAGVYLLVRLSPVVVESPFAMSVIAIVGAMTALLAASIALVQNQMKKILAYSTVSQLGFMFAAVGTGAFAGGFFHVFTHGFFKACLFLGAGSVMHAVHAHGDADIRYLGGLRKKLPATHMTFAIATAAIAGVPLLSGFFSKDEILLGAATWATAMPVSPWVGWLVLAMLVLAATMTAFYMFRLYFRTFWGSFKGGHPPDEHHADEEEEHGHHAEPHESPKTMTIPLWILAGGAAIVGFLGLPHAFHLPNWWSNWMTPQHEVFLQTMEESLAGGAEHEAAVREGTLAARQVVSAVASLQHEGQLVHAPSWVAFLAMGLGILAVLLGAGLAYSWYAKEGNEAPERLKKQMPGLHRLLMDKWRVDEAYGWVIVAPMKWLAVFAANIDRFFVDGILARASAFSVQGAGWLLTRTQNGLVYAYAGLFVLGFAALGWWFTYPHADLQAEPGAGTIQWTASRGLGYQYRWDFDSDGTFEVEEWTDEATVTHDYEGAAYYGLVVAFGASREPLGDAPEILVEQGGDAQAIPPELLGPEWQALDAPPIPPTLTYREGALQLRINGAAMQDTDGEDDGVMILQPGESFSVGAARMTVAVRVRGTVEIRNAFGNLSRETEDVTLRVPRRVARAEVQR